MLSKFSVTRPYTVFVAVVLVIVLGLVSFTGMTVDLFPGMELPYVVAMTTYPGAGPEQVELEVTRPLEAGLGTTSGVVGISSVSSENFSLVIIEFAQGTNMDSAMIDLSAAIDLVYGQLDDLVARPTLMRINPDMMPVMIATVDLEGESLGEVSDFVEETLLPSLERIDGVAAVSASGILEEKLQIILDQAKIDQLNAQIQDDISEAFDEAEASLRDARSELNSAQAGLSAERASQQAALAEASAEMDSMIAQLNSLIAEETKLKAEQAAFEQEKKFIEEALALEELIDNPSAADIRNLNADELRSLLENLAENLPPEYADLSPEEMSGLLEMAAGAVSRTRAIDNELENISRRLMVIEAMLPELESGLNQALAGYEQVEEGKMILTFELARAQAQLDSGRSEMERGITEIENAREKALSDAEKNSIFTAEMISNLIMAQNFTMPAGYLGDSDQVVKVSGQFESIDALENSVLFSLDSVGDVLVSDLAEITVINNAHQNYARVNGNDAVLLSFQKQSTASTTVVAGNINKAFDDLSDDYPGLRILPLMDQGENINMIIDSVWQNLLIGGSMAILILLIFLRDFRPTLIIALSIPISLMFALTLMYFSNVTLNIISLSGLALGVGMLVDNSVVSIENIYRLRNAGVSLGTAAIQGARQVGGALFASTLTTVCVFLPIVFTQGLTRQLFSDMGLTIAYSLLASLVVALTLVPTMASMILSRRSRQKPGWFDRLTRVYARLLYHTLKRKALVLILVIGLLALSIYGVTVVGTSFMPEMESAQMSASLSLPPDSSDQELYAAGDQMLERILELTEVETVGALSGEAGGMFGSSGGVTFYIRLQEDRTMSNAEVAQQISDKTADLEGDISVSTSDFDLSALGGSGIEIIVRGNSIDQLYETAQELSDLLYTIDGIEEVLTGDEDGGRETRIEVDQDKAIREGLTVIQVFQEVSAALSPEKRSTTLRAEQGDYPVIVVGTEAGQLTPENLGRFSFNVSGFDGEESEVYLEDVATISEAYSPSSIRRENQSRYISVRANLEEGYNIGLVSRDIDRVLENYRVPEGMDVHLAGETEMIENAISDMALMITLAVIFIYLIMVAQFQSLLSPLIILFTLPLAFTGGLLLLWVTGIELSLPAMLGFLVLAGIVVNNGIVFIDYVNKLREAGLSKRKALLKAGMTRLRPILMTTITTVLAMVPISLGLGSGSEATQPMAVVAVGGLSYATLLTLLIVPVMYDLLNRESQTVGQAEQ